MPLNTMKDLTIKGKTSKKDERTKREKKQSAGKRNRKKKDQKSKIYGKYGEHDKNVCPTNNVCRTKKASLPHISLRLECSH